MSCAGEAELLAELNRRRLLHQQRVGSRVDREPVAVLGVNQSAEARRGLEQDERDVAARELERGGQAGDAAADDDDHALPDLFPTRPIGAVASELAEPRAPLVRRARALKAEAPSPASRMLTGDAMHIARELLNAFERRTGQHAVAEVEDVPGTAADASQHVVGAARTAGRPGRAAASGSRLPCIAAIGADDRPRPRRAAGASRGRSRRRPPRPGRAGLPSSRRRSG